MLQGYITVCFMIKAQLLILAWFLDDQRSSFPESKTSQNFCFLSHYHHFNLTQWISSFIYWIAVLSFSHLGQRNKQPYCYSDLITWHISFARSSVVHNCLFDSAVNSSAIGLGLSFPLKLCILFWKCKICRRQSSCRPLQGDHCCQTISYCDTK